MIGDVHPALAQRLAERRASIDDFRVRWAAFTRRWRRAAAEGPEVAAALVEEVLRNGLPEADASRGVEPPPEALLRAARAVVAASGFLDADEYSVRHRLRRGTDPYRHHVHLGWRLLQNPSPRFDLWSYWVEHLDPTTEGVDPLLHWLLVGRQLGWEPVPPTAPVRPAHTLGATPRRICLFAAYDSDGVVDDYVVTYLRELARHADVFYLADGVLEPGELDKLADVTRGAWSVPHAGYDFGSFSLLARDLVGWDVVDTYDELLLANDSCYLVHPLDEVFAAMDARPGDWWSLQATSMEHDENYFLDDSPIPLAEAKQRFLGPRHFSDVHYLHLSSYFLAFRRPVVADPGFRWRLDTVVPQEAKALVVHKYEVGISRYLVDAGFDFDTWLPELQPFHPLYSRHVFDLVERGFPLIKRNFLGENPRRAPDVARWRERLGDVAPVARTEEMAANIARVTDPARLHDAYDVAQDPATGRRIVRPSPLAGHPFRRMDRETPSFSHWWAFAAGPSGRLDPGVRAVLDAVRDDPSLHAVVLTRTRALLDDVSGARVTVVPIGTREGQETVVRCGVLVLSDPLEVALPHVVLPARHRIVHVGASLAAGTPVPVLGMVDAVAVSSVREADAWRAAEPGLAADGAWLTGMPRHDLLLPDAELPPDLARAEAGLRARLAGRPLVVLTATGPATYTPADVALLQKWARDAGVVVGVREPRPDAPHGLTRLLAPLAPVGLSDRSVVSEAVVLRAASAVVADSPAGRSDARAAGHPLVVNRAGDPVDPLLEELSSLAAAGWPPEASPGDDGVPLDGGAARRFVRRVRLRELERLEVRRAR